MFSHIENTFNLKFLSYFEHNNNGTTRPETPIYSHPVLHSNFAVFKYDMYIVGCLGVCGNIQCNRYLKLLLFPASNCNSHALLFKEMLKPSTLHHICQLEVHDTLHINDRTVSLVPIYYSQCCQVSKMDWSEI